MTLQRRLLRLETVNGRHSLAHLTDGELDTRLRAELAEWLAAEPDACPADVRAKVSAFLAEPALARAHGPQKLRRWPEPAAVIDLGRRLPRLEGAGAGVEAPRSAVVIYHPGETPDAAVRRHYGDAPPPVVVMLPHNNRDPQPPHPAVPGHEEPT